MQKRGGFVNRQQGVGVVDIVGAAGERRREFFSNYTPNLVNEPVEGSRRDICRLSHTSGI